MNKETIEFIAVLGGMIIGYAIGIGSYFLIKWLRWRRYKKIIDLLLEEDMKKKFEDHERQTERH